MLIVLRGNSGSGKSSVAASLQRAMGRGTAVVGQDHLRRVMLREHDVPGGDNIDLIRTSAEFCLARGYNTIVEGILIAEHYRDMLTALIAGHHGPTLLVYLDVPLDVTLRRHEGRPMRAEVAPDRLRTWYVPCDLLGTAHELVIEGDVSVEDVVARIQREIGPYPTKESRAGARFL